MKNMFKINTKLEIPLYQQLVDSMSLAIKKGELESGAKLPTVQEMTQQLNVARGTVKRAYDELERDGFIEKVQGRGTFVCYKSAESLGRKEQAMAAIDEMLNNLENMGFSATEINIFLNLKLRERSEEEEGLKVAVVECNPENLSSMVEQLRKLGNFDLYSFTVDNIKEYPYKLKEKYDLILTTSFHYEYIQSIVPDKTVVTRAALRPTADCLARIIKLKAGKKVGIIGYSERFAKLIYNTCANYNEGIALDGFVSQSQSIKDYIKDKEVILVPEAYQKYFSADDVKEIEGFDGNVIECKYEFDEGTKLYLEAKVKKLMEKKKFDENFGNF